MRAGVETRPYNVILRLQTEESPSDCKIFAGDIHECPTDKSKVLRFNQGFPRNVTHPNVSICEERTHKGSRGCPLGPVIKLRGSVWAFCFFCASIKKSSKTFHALRVAGKLMD